MKRYFLLLTVLVSQIASANTCELSCDPYEMPQPVCTSFFYGDVGVGPLPILLPTFALGYRTQWNHTGYDASIQVASLGIVTALKGSLLYHYYFQPSLCSQFYAGAGIAGGGVFKSDGDTFPFVAPEFVFGKQYITDTGGLRFFQIQANFPTFYFQEQTHWHEWDLVDISWEHNIMWIPVVTISYGIGF